jgi:hypothetical protein
MLSAVSGDINCVFLHLLENSRLCDRTAVEIVTTQQVDEPDHAMWVGGKREQASAQKGKESRGDLRVVSIQPAQYNA